MFTKKVLLGALLCGFLLYSTQSASAGTIIKVGLGNTGPDVALVNQVFGTVNDGNAGTTGHQDTNIDFVGALDGLTDILTGASFTLFGVVLNGVASVTNGVVAQATAGGQFRLYDAANTLLLQGDVAAGVITGSTNASTGAFFNTNTAVFTGGTLMTYLLPTSAEISIALSNILTGGQVGLHPANVCCQNGPLLNFTANATGLIGGDAAVPEPFTAGLLASGLLTGALLRKRKQTR